MSLDINNRLSILTLDIKRGRIGGNIPDTIGSHTSVLSAVPSGHIGYSQLLVIL